MSRGADRPGEPPAAADAASGDPSLDPDRARRPRTATGTVGAVVGLGLGLLYLINPTAGILELLPDNLPVVGNLDEAAATGLVLGALAYLGIDLVGPFRRARRGPAEGPGPGPRS